jgi:hypothetical protein
MRNDRLRCAGGVETVCSAAADGAARERRKDSCAQQRKAMAEMGGRRGVGWSPRCRGWRNPSARGGFRREAMAEMGGRRGVGWSPRCRGWRNPSTQGGFRRQREEIGCCTAVEVGLGPSAGLRLSLLLSWRLIAGGAEARAESALARSAAGR